MTAWAIFAIRCLLVPMALLVLWLFGSSLIQLSRGSQSLNQLGRSDRAMFALCILTGQLFYLAWPEPAVLLLALSFASTALGLSIAVSLTARRKGLHRIEDLIDRPDLALPLIELNDLDPVKARAMAMDVRAEVARARIAL